MYIEFFSGLFIGGVILIAYYEMYKIPYIESNIDCDKFIPPPSPKDFGTIKVKLQEAKNPGPRKDYLG